MRALLLASLWSTPASAVSLTLVDETTPHPGVTVRHYTTRSPSAHVWVAAVDLCAAGVHVDATKAPSSLTTASGWGSGQGAQLAVNGDFYATGPVRVYGRAIGNGVTWPAVQTQSDARYSSHWAYQDYGWIALGHDEVRYTHTKWVKRNANRFGGSLGGYKPGTVGAGPPPGTLALVSGFPELVVEGQQVTCSSPTASDCFPDRTDMRSRHPRTAMGLTKDRGTLLLVTVDGRTTRSSGMYGAELAELMKKLGSHVAFNLDGGGSTQMWVAGRGTVNDARGNNGGSVRAVANHWGVFSGASGWPKRPGHCETETPCKVLGPGGGVVDNGSSCFRTFGPSAYWRRETAGRNDLLYWTNAWETDRPSNWAWWRVDLEEAGEYRVQAWIDPEFGVFDRARYGVYADRTLDHVVLDQGSADGWSTLGTWFFEAGGEQFVAVYDHADGPVARDQHIVADAVRLVRVDPWCGDGTCDDDEDCESCPEDCPIVTEIPDNGRDDDCDGETDEVDEDPETDSTDATDDTDVGEHTDDVMDPDTDVEPWPEHGCACAAAPGTPWWVFGAAFSIFARRRTG